MSEARNAEIRAALLAAIPREQWVEMEEELFLHSCRRDGIDPVAQGMPLERVEAIEAKYEEVASRTGLERPFAETRAQRRRSEFRLVTR